MQAQMIGRCDVQHITHISETNQTIQQMIAVLALARHMQTQIYLRARVPRDYFSRHQPV